MTTLDKRLDQPGNDRTNHLIASYEPIGALYDIAIKEEELLRQKAAAVAAIKYDDNAPYGAINATAAILNMTPGGVTAFLKRHGLFRQDPDRKITRIMSKIMRGIAVSSQDEQFLRDHGVNPEDIKAGKEEQA